MSGLGQSAAPDESILVLERLLKTVVHMKDEGQVSSILDVSI